MCAIFGFLNYGKKVSASTLKRLLRALSVAAESRGTDATGISYVNNGNIVTFKKAKPAHKVKLYFPKDTTAVIGHTRFTTQGSEKHNYNNHPFEGTTNNHTFGLTDEQLLALANGADSSAESKPVSEKHGNDHRNPYAVSEELEGQMSFGDN